MRTNPLSVETPVGLRTGERGRPGPKDDLIIDTVLAQIEAVGYDNVDLRTIARDAPVSLETVSRSFPSRDALLLAAVKQWMGRQVYGPMSAPDRRSPVSDRLGSLMHGIVEPWLDDPRMLQAFVRAARGRGHPRRGAARARTAGVTNEPGAWYGSSSTSSTTRGTL